MKKPAQASIKGPCSKAKAAPAKPSAKAKAAPKAETEKPSAKAAQKQRPPSAEKPSAQAPRSELQALQEELALAKAEAQAERKSADDRQLEVGRLHGVVQELRQRVNDLSGAEARAQQAEGRLEGQQEAQQRMEAMLPDLINRVVGTMLESVRRRERPSCLSTTVKCEIEDSATPVPCKSIELTLTDGVGMASRPADAGSGDGRKALLGFYAAGGHGRSISDEVSQLGRQVSSRTPRRGSDLFLSLGGRSRQLGP